MPHRRGRRRRPADDALLGLVLCCAGVAPLCGPARRASRCERPACAVRCETRLFIDRVRGVVVALAGCGPAVGPGGAAGGLAACERHVVRRRRTAPRRQRAGRPLPGAAGRARVVCAADVDDGFVPGGVEWFFVVGESGGDGCVPVGAGWSGAEPSGLRRWRCVTAFWPMGGPGSRCGCRPRAVRRRLRSAATSCRYEVLPRGVEPDAVGVVGVVGVVGHVFFGEPCGVASAGRR